MFIYSIKKLNRNVLFLIVFRGRTPEWYNKSYGHIAALHLRKIRNSFKHTTDGPESKVWEKLTVQPKALHGVKICVESEVDNDNSDYQSSEVAQNPAFLKPPVEEDWHEIQTPIIDNNNPEVFI